MSTPTSTAITSYCTNCNKECKPLKCTACKLVSYCSRECQRMHWKASHSKTCPYKQQQRNEKRKLKEKKAKATSTRTRTSVRATAAAYELNSLLSNMSIPKMKEHYDKSMDQIQIGVPSLKIEPVEQLPTSTSTSASTSTSTSTSKSPPSSPIVDTIETNGAKSFNKKDSSAIPKLAVSLPVEEKDIQNNNNFIPSSSSSVPVPVPVMNPSSFSFVPSPPINTIATTTTTTTIKSTNTTANTTTANKTMSNNKENNNMHSICEYSIEKLLYTSSYTITIILPNDELTLMKENLLKATNNINANANMNINTNTNTNQNQFENQNQLLQQHFQQNLKIDIQNLDNNNNNNARGSSSRNGNKIKSKVQITMHTHNTNSSSSSSGVGGSTSSIKQNDKRKQKRNIQLASINLPDYILSDENTALSSLSIYNNDKYDDEDDNYNYNYNYNHGNAINNHHGNREDHKKSKKSQHQQQQQQPQTTYLLIRLYYNNNNNDNIIVDDNESLVSFTSLDALNNIQCRFCHEYLRRKREYKYNHRQDQDQAQQSQSQTEMKSLFDTDSTSIMTNSNTDTDTTMNIIRGVYHLPNGYWDEITDYLSCYDGEATIDFAASANKIEQGIAFEDECIIVMNKQDLHNTCILAIDGYGEQDFQSNATIDMPTATKAAATSIVDMNDNDNHNDNQKKEAEEAEKINEENNKMKIDVESSGGVLYRGKRAWKDSVGGATVCCSQCCSILGYAALEEPDTCRLLKHRLCAKVEKKHDEDDNDIQNNSINSNLRKTRDYFSHNTCASFIARELTRYAESQAVFTFVIFDEESTGRFLLLKLLSWNTSMGIAKTCEQRTNEQRSCNGNETQNHEVEFRRIAKIIFEEIEDPNHHLIADSTDPMNFSWGDIDECCPPFGNTAASPRIDTTTQREKSDTNSNLLNNVSFSTASVQIHLPRDEWKQLREAIQKGKKFIPDSISQATVLLKLGDGGEVNKGKAAMSFLQLPFIK